MKTVNRRNLKTLSAVAILLVFAGRPMPAQDCPSRYKRFFVHYVDKRSFVEKALNLIGLTSQDVGRSFAIVAGASHYPRLPLGQRELLPAQVDRDKLVAYLKTEEFFDEIVVLWDVDMNSENMTYFLRDYFPRRLASFPKSRFLLAYSGHGFDDSHDGYLLGYPATNTRDKSSAFALRDLRLSLNEVIRSGYQVLVLLNACYGGAFLGRTSFGGRYLPKHPGAHAITAGAVGERTWSDPRGIGFGSVFYEKLLAGLAGPADKFPDGPDGIITATELYSYLRQEVQISTDQTQCPQLGDLAVSQSEGEFFFLNRSRQINAGILPAWNPILVQPFGGKAQLQTDEQGAGTPSDTPLSVLAGSLSPDFNIAIQTSGSFGDHEIGIPAGVVHVELALSPTAARYEQIELRTPRTSTKLRADFSPGFGRPVVPIELDLTLSIIVGTSHPSTDLSLIPIAGGGYRISQFATSDCNFSCYYLEFIGTWTARGPDLVAYGTIRSALTGFGIGADATTEVDPAGYPQVARLKNFRWNFNSGGAAIPDLVNARVNGVPIQLKATYVGVPIPGMKSSDFTLTMGAVPN